MKKSSFLLLCLGVTLAVLIGCGGSDAPTDLAPPETGAAAPAAPAIQAFSGEVLETMESGGYTYVLVDTGSDQNWAASNNFEVAVGDRVTVPIESPMADFHSDTLDRSFDVIYFASRIVPEGTAMGGGMMGGGSPALTAGHTTAEDAGVDASSIKTPQGGLKIEQVWADRDSLSGKTVVISGKVVKYNGGIMGANWLHIQDGSGSAADGTNDLTVTTSASAAVGDIVTVTGALTLDKDFGSGYRYSSIILDAEVVKN